MPTVETQAGLAKIFGLNTDAANAAGVTTLTGAATITIESGDLEHKFDLEEIKGQDNNVETLIGSNEQLEVTINFAPNGATRAAAATSAANMFPGMVSKVVLANFKVAKYNGDYNYIGGGTVRMTKDGPVVMGIKLRAYLANRASLTAAVIAG